MAVGETRRFVPKLLQHPSITFWLCLMDRLGYRGLYSLIVFLYFFEGGIIVCSAIRIYIFLPPTRSIKIPRFFYYPDIHASSYSCMSHAPRPCAFPFYFIYFFQINQFDPDPINKWWIPPFVHFLDIVRFVAISSVAATVPIIVRF